MADTPISLRCQPLVASLTAVRCTRADIHCHSSIHWNLCTVPAPSSSLTFAVLRQTSSGFNPGVLVTAFLCLILGPKPPSMMLRCVIVNCIA